MHLGGEKIRGMGRKKKQKGISYDKKQKNSQIYIHILSDPIRKTSEREVFFFFFSEREQEIVGSEKNAVLWRDRSEASIIKRTGISLPPESDGRKVSTPYFPSMKDGTSAAHNAFPGQIFTIWSTGADKRRKMTRTTRSTRSERC